MRYLTLFALLAACDGGKESDVDGDGVEAPADCDDNDANVKPGAVELCDGIDNNCDNQVDEGVGDSYFIDVDGDGFGDLSLAAERFCEAPVGYVLRAGDCDDSNDGINPDQAEDCTPIDRNCDGDPLLNAQGEGLWYRDADGDGYGATQELSGVAPVESCDAPAGYVSTDDDCDDTRADVNPAGTEVCNSIDDDCNGTPDDNPTDGVVVYPDVDRDGFGASTGAIEGCPTFGFVEDNTDCDDAVATTFPGADEVCNGGVDDDCDATTLEEVLDGTTFYVDADGDTYGDTPVVACEQPSNAVVRAGDCDDGDDAVNPGADETCDAVDQDCDGDPVAGAVDAVRYYRDSDSDSYGDATSGIDSCTPIASYVTTAGDCNDYDGLINPGADERCNGGVDDDCSASTDDDDSPDAPLWYFDTDGDGYAGALLPQQFCEAPLYGFATAEDCNDNDEYTYPGAIEVCDGGIDNDCDPSTDEELVSSFYEDADGDGFGNNSVSELGCTPSAALLNPTPIPGDCDDADATLNPTLTPDCIQDHCGTLSSSQVWKSTVEHTVSCDVKVEGANSPNLTIQDGSIVRFAQGTSLKVADIASGSITVDAPGAGVLMTSLGGVPQNGDWRGIEIGDQDDGSVLRGLTVEFAGGGGASDSAGITLDLGSSTIELDSVVAMRNAGDGIRVKTGSPLIHDSMLIDNDRNGLYVMGNQGLSRLDQGGAEGPSFTGNMVTGNGDRPITVPGSHADEIGQSLDGSDPDVNVFEDPLNPNGIQEIELLTGTMRTTGSWQYHDMPYYVAPGVTITVQDGPEAILRIDEQVTVYFDEGAGLVVGSAAQGALLIGDYPNPSAPADTVYLLADPALSANNLNWAGVTIGPQGSTSRLAGVVMEEGGGNNKGNLYINGSAPRIAYSEFRGSDSAGITVEGALAAPLITNTDLLDNDTYGLFVAANSGIAREVGAASFVGNLLVNNGTTSVVLPPDYVGQLDASTVYADADPTKGVRMHGGVVSESAFWQKLDADYEILGNVAVGGPQDPELTIEPGSTLYVSQGAEVSAGVSDDGAILIDATPANRVVFTSARATPGAGDWVGLRIGDNGPLFQQTRLIGVDVEYAGLLGSANSGAIELRTRDGGCPSYYAPERDVVLRNVRIYDSSSTGVHLKAAGRAALENVEVYSPLDGLCFVAVPVGSCPQPYYTQWDNVTCDAVPFGIVNIDISLIESIDPAAFYGYPITVNGSVVNADVTIPAVSDGWVFNDGLNVGGAANPTLTIADGAELVFPRGTGLDVGYDGPGGLVMNGNSTAVLTALLPANGWAGVGLGPECSVDIQGGTVAFGGESRAAAVRDEFCAPGGTIDGLSIDSSVVPCDYQSPLDDPADAGDFVPQITITGATFGFCELVD